MTKQKRQRGPTTHPCTPTLPALAVPAIATMQATYAIFGQQRIQTTIATRPSADWIYCQFGCYFSSPQHTCAVWRRQLLLPANGTWREHHTLRSLWMCVGISRHGLCCHRCGLGAFHPAPRGSRCERPNQHLHAAANRQVRLPKAAGIRIFSHTSSHMRDAASAAARYGAHGLLPLYGQSAQPSSCALQAAAYAATMFFLCQRSTTTQAVNKLKISIPKPPTLGTACMPEKNSLRIRLFI